MQLNATYTSGTYTSKIFDAGAVSQWNNISWTQGGYYQQELPNNKGIEGGLGGANMTGNVLLLHMNEESGTIVDYSGEGNNGTTYGGVTYGANGKLNSALSFDRVDDYVSTGLNPDAEIGDSNAFTVSVWIKPNDDTTNQEAIGSWYANDKRFYFGIINGSYYWGLGSVYDPTTQTVPEVGKWQHLVWVYEGGAGNILIYLNGINTYSQSYTGNGDMPEANIPIGGTKPFNGTIDEVAIYNRTLSAEEIRNMYLRGTLRLNLTVRSCDDENCSGESWTDVTDVSPQTLFLDNLTFFQYKYNLETDDSSYTPELYNVLIDYNVLNAKPTVTLNAPENNSYISVDSSLLNATVYDSDLDNMTVWFYGDGNLLTTFYNQTNGTTLTYNWTSLSKGLHNWTVIANDGTVNNTNEYYYFTVDLINPNLIVSYPVNGTTYKLHSYETTLDLNYTATDINIDSCWFTNVTGQNETLANCNNGTINIPDQVNDNNYNITVYVNDSAGNLNSSQIFFTTDYSQGYPNNTQINMSGAEKVATWFDISTSSICAGDWCENVSVTLIYDSDNCQLANGYQASYVKGDYNETDTVTQNWVARCNVVGTYIFTVNYTVQNGSFDSANATISIAETYAKTVYEQTALGDYYSREDNMTIAVTLEDSDGNPVTNDNVYVDIFYPNLTQWIDNLQLTEIASGLYAAKQAIPSDAPYGDYTVYYIGNNFVAARVFRVTKTEEYLEDIYDIVNYINTTITNTIIPYLQEINSTTHTTYTYLTDTVNPNILEINSTVTDILNKWGDYNASQIFEKINDTYYLVNNTKNETSALLEKWGTYNAQQLYNKINDTYDLVGDVYTKVNETYNLTLEINNSLTQVKTDIENISSRIGSSSDDESQNTLFGEHAYTQNRLAEINSNLTYLKTLTEHINETTEAINSTVSTILLEVDDLEELHQCSISPNSTICTLLNNIYSDTQNIYDLSLAINQTISSMNLFEISALIAGSPRYANEEALIEATFSGQNGSYVTPDTISLTIYDPNDNIWTTATKAQFTKGSDHIWQYAKSISATPTTGMYTVHMQASYQDVNSSRSAQFRIATGGPYKVYLECPASSYLGQNLVCSVILLDEGEVPTESTSTVWLDLDNNGVWDVGETQMSFSKQTVPLQNVTQSISLNIPSTYPTGLQVIRLDTSYASSAQPNSGASDTVTFSTAPAGDDGDTGGGTVGGGGITGRTTEEIVCNSPYIRYGKECCLDENNNSICDVDERLPAEEVPGGENKTPEELPKGKPEFLDIKISKTYLFIGAGALVFILLLIFIIIKIFKHRNRSGKVKLLESKLRHLKELKSRKEISKSSYATERGRLLSRINTILKSKHLVLILGAVGLIGLFRLIPKPIMTGGAIGVGESNLTTISWWAVLVTLAVLALIGIFVVLIYILKEIRKFTRGEASFVPTPLAYSENNLKTIKQANKNINTKSTTTSLNTLINKKVLTDSGHYLGEIKEIVLRENRIDSLKIKLDKHQGFNVKGIIVKYQNVKSVGHIVIVDGKILEKINSFLKQHQKKLIKARKEVRKFLVS